MRTVKRISLKARILIFIALIVYAAIVASYYKYYSNTVDIIKSEYKTGINLIEQSIINETKYTEILSLIAEKDLEEDMKKISYELLELYQEDPHVLQWNMDELRDKYGQMDIYVINEDLEILTSSLEGEIGMSFANLPSFARTLRNRMAGHEFKSDSINFSMQKNELKKYSYMPTPDKKYLLELSVTIGDRYPELENLNILYLSKNLIDKYPFIEAIQVHKYDADKGKSDILFFDEEMLAENNILEQDDNLIRTAVETLEVQEHIIQADGNNYTIKYIPHNYMASEIRMNWWGNYVIEIVYNDLDIMRSIDKQRVIFYQNIALTSVIYIALSYMIIYTIFKNREISYIDYLTQIPNRKRFEEHMEVSILTANKRDTKIAVLFLDLDGFKEINDVYGHNVGDKVLQEVARRLKISMPQNGIICRLGGDEFIGAISDFTSFQDIEGHIDTISSIFEKTFKVDGYNISISSSIGISMYPECSSSIDQLIQGADDAMYHAKNNQLKFSLCDE